MFASWETICVKICPIKHGGSVRKFKKKRKPNIIRKPISAFVFLIPFSSNQTLVKEDKFLKEQVRVNEIWLRLVLKYKINFINSHNNFRVFMQ